MKLDADVCDLGFSEESGTCAIDTKVPPSPSAPLTRRQRVARLLVGTGFHSAGLIVGGRRTLRPLAIVAHWFGASHLVAATAAYRGCPELGAIPSLVLRRPLATICGPWEAIDRRFALED